MKFYNRNNELSLLQSTRKIAFSNHSQMTVLTGRRRVGKTKLMLKSCEGSPTVYLFVGRNNEAALSRQFAETASRELGVFMPQGIGSFIELFEQLMSIGRHQAFNLIIDEFQEFFYINESVYSGIHTDAPHLHGIQGAALWPHRQHH